MRKATGIFVLIALLWTNLSFAQNSGKGSPKASQYMQLQKVMKKLQNEIETIPYNIQRVATQRLGYDTTRLTRQGYKLIRHEIERVFREDGRIKMLALEEFRRDKVLFVEGTDSTLTLSNTQRSAGEKENSIRLLELSQKYGIDAFLQGNIQYKNDLGYVITLELISPQSREVLWSKSLVSKDLTPEKKPYKGKLTLISAGGSLLPTGSYTIGGTGYTGGILFVDYTARVALRQPVNERNGGYIGVRGGYHYYNTMPKGQNTTNYEPFTQSVFEVGVIFYKTLAEKNKKKHTHWLELYLGPNLLIPSGSQNMFALAQGININLSENLGLALDVQYLLSPNPEVENETKNIQLNSVGYGLKVLLRL